MMRIHSAVNNINRKSVITRMLIGAILGLGLISLFVFSVKNPKRPIMEDCLLLALPTY